jgi:ATP-dependent HslUV protease subunit HslV
MSLFEAYWPVIRCDPGLRCGTHRTVMAGDGQVTFGSTVLKQSAKKIRRLYNDTVLAGFAGSRRFVRVVFEIRSKLEQYRGNLERAAVELARL